VLTNGRAQRTAHAHRAAAVDNRDAACADNETDIGDVIVPRDIERQGLACVHEHSGGDFAHGQRIRCRGIQPRGHRQRSQHRERRVLEATSEAPMRPAAQGSGEPQDEADGSCHPRHAMRYLELLPAIQVAV